MGWGRALRAEFDEVGCFAAEEEGKEVEVDAGEGDDGEEGDVEGGAAEAPDVPRERVRTEGVSGSVSRGWKKAFGRVR